MSESRKGSQDILAEEGFSTNGKSKTSISQGSGCIAPRPGQPCPVCGKGIMNYNGLLILSCAVCGYREPGGGFT